MRKDSLLRGRLLCIWLKTVLDVTLVAKISVSSVRPNPIIKVKRVNRTNLKVAGFVVRSSSSQVLACFQPSRLSAETASVSKRCRNRATSFWHVDIRAVAPKVKHSAYPASNPNALKRCPRIRDPLTTLPSSVTSATVQKLARIQA